MKFCFEDQFVPVNINGYIITALLHWEKANLYIFVKLPISFEEFL